MSGLEHTYVDDVIVPRALLVLSEEVLTALSHVVPPSLDDDYELAVAQLRIASIKPSEPIP